MGNRSFCRLLVFVWVLLAWPGMAAAGDLANAQLLIAGSRLTVSPESQTVPFDTPTIVETHLQGYDAGHGVLPIDLRVLADFTGPEVDGVLVLETLPNQPFRIPRLRLQGEYRLDNIRLVQGSTLLAYAAPRSSSVLVTQILITRVTSRALTLDEIRSYGIVVDDSSFQAFNFTFAFAVAGETVNYNVPVIYYGPAGDQQAVLWQGPNFQASPWRSSSAHFDPPRMAPFQLHFAAQAGDESSGGCQDPEGDCGKADIVPIPGVILFPTDVSLLHQFFSVVLMAQNGAPAGDRLTIRDLTARVTLPPGLRQSKTEPPTPLGVPVPVRVPGADGKLGTADDLTFLVAQATGQAEVEVEGLAEGTHIVRFDLDGILEGLPGGQIRRVTGEARGAVIVRDPTLNVTITHPDVVRADEEYTMLLTVTNTGNAPANQLKVRLPAEKLSGVEVVGANEKTVTVAPGDAELLEFRLRSRRTGRVTATAARGSSQIAAVFDLSVGVGENGIPLSPNAIILPRSTDSLPPDLVRNALNLIGLGFSLATAPPSLLRQDLPRISRSAVDGRVYQLAEAGSHVALGEDLFDSAAQLAAEWTGARDADWDWDLLRRTTQKGARVGASLGAIFAAEAAAHSPREAFDHFFKTTGYLPVMEGALATGAGVTLEISSRTGGQKLAGDGNDAARVRALPFADLYDLGQAQMALLAVPEAGGYRARIRSSAIVQAGLNVLVPGADGALRMVRWTGVALDPGGSATVDFRAVDSAFTLAVDTQGDGTVDDQIEGTVETLERRPFRAIGAVQNVEVDPSGHVVDVLFSTDVDPRALIPGDPRKFAIPGKVSNGGSVQAESDVTNGAGSTVHNPFAGLRNTRIVRVVFNNPLSPYVAQDLAVSGVKNPLGEQVTAATVRVLTPAAQPGMQVAGTVYGSDGRPVPFAQVELRESDICLFCEAVCRTHKTAVVRADAAGHFLFDYVRQTGCSDVYQLQAIDATSGESGTATGRVRLVGQQAQLDVVMLGRGTIRGRVTYDDGTVPPGARVIAESPVFRIGRAATLDASGNYSVSGVPVGTVTLSATDGQGRFTVTTVEIPGAGSVVSHNLVILRRPGQPVASGDVRGVIYRPDGTTPVTGAYVALYVDGNLVGVRHSGSDGRFDFGPAPVGRGEIETFEGVTGQSGVQVFFDVHPDQVNQVGLVMRDQRGVVQGYVYRRTAAGNVPLFGAVVWAEGTPFQTVTNPQGFYQLEGVFAGTRNISAADLQRKLKVSEAVTIGSEGQVVDRNLYFQDTAVSGIAGEVLGFDGNPVSGATVHLANGDQRWFRTATTDSSGRFLISDLGVGSYGVHAFKGAAGSSQGATIRFAGDTPFVSLRFKKGSIHGVVRVAGGGAAPVGTRAVITYRTTTVRLELVGLDLESHTLETGADGTFDLPDVLAGPYVITASNAFYGSKTVHGEVAGNGIEAVEVTFDGTATGTVRGVVLGPDGVTPVPGATIKMRHPNLGDYDLTSGATGSFAFELVPPVAGAFPIEVTASDGIVFRQAQAWVQLNKPGQELDLEIVLPKQGSLSGQVRDSNGQPVPGAVVTLQEGSYPRRKLVVNADVEGNFAYQNVFAGMVTLSARAPALGGLGGKTTAEITAEGEEVTGIVISLEPTGGIAGQVTSPVDGSAVASAEVRLLRGGHLFDTVTAGPDGRFELSLLPLATYDLRAFDPRTGRFGRRTGLAVAANGQVVTGDLQLEPRGTVTGHLYEAGTTAGVPGSTIQLNAYSIEGFITYSSTDAGGAFEFQGIPRGRFDLFGREPAGRRRAYARGEIVSDGQQLTLDLFLDRQATLTGSVLNPPGAPDGVFPNANTVIYQDGQIIGATLASNYSFPGVVLGRPYELYTREVGGAHQGQVFSRVDQDGEVRVDVRMHPIGSVVINVVDSFGHPVSGAQVDLWDQGFYGDYTGSQRFRGDTGGDNSITFQTVGEGRLSVYATDPATGLRGSASGGLNQDGQIVELSVMLQSSAGITGHLVLPDGTTPAAQALAAVQTGGRTLTVFTDDAGVFTLPSLPLGSFLLVLQEHQGPGTREVRGSLTANGQLLDLGTLVLDAVDPQVAGVTPAAGAVDVSRNSAVVVRFSEPMDTTRNPVSNLARIETAAGQLVGADAVWIDGDTAIRATPRQPLANASIFRIKIDRSLIFDKAGRHLAQSVQTTFTTADQVPPAVIDASPVNGARQVPLASPVRLTFSEVVNPATLSGSAIRLTDVTAGAGVTTTYLLDVTGRSVTITPVTSLIDGHAYQLTLTGVADPVGNVMPTFTSAFYTADTTPPVIGSILPAEGATFTAGDPMPVSTAVTDPAGVASVTLRIGAWVLPDSAAPYAWSVPAPVVAAAGDVTLQIEAVDAWGNRATAVRTVHVQPRANTHGPQAALGCFPLQVVPGDQILIPFHVSDDEAVESYTLAVDGTRADGAPLVNVATVDSSFVWTVPASAAAGDTLVLRLEARDFAGNVAAEEKTLRVAAGTVLAGDQTVSDSHAGETLVLSQGIFTISQPLHVAGLTLQRGAVLKAAPGSKAAVIATGRVEVGCGTRIDVSTLGYAGGTASQPAGGAPAGVSASQPDAGGSHGGTGALGTAAGPAGAVYDSVYEPSRAGGGGSFRSPGNIYGNRGGAGGGTAAIEAGELVLDGTVQALGETRAYNEQGGGGAGGTVWVRAGTLSGAGSIDVSGGAAGACDKAAGPGGGGRVALRVQTLSGFDPASQVRSWGGKRTVCNDPARASYAAPGTVYVFDSSSTYGRLLVDSGEVNGVAQQGPATELPALSGGSVTAFSASGADAWVSASAALRPEWLGAWMVLKDGAGAALGGGFQVVEIDVAGRARLAGAGALSGVASYAGEYRFDNIDLLHGAGLLSSTPVAGSQVELQGDAEVTGDVTAVNLLVKSGAVVHPASGGALRFRVSGRMKVEAGARVDVSSLGSAGGTASLPAGGVLSGVDAAQPDSGGSHGGTGALGTTTGPAGEVFDNLYAPFLAGGGGSFLAGNSFGGTRGGAGGGTVEIEAGELVLDGAVQAVGETRAYNEQGGGGGGGAVWVRAGVLSGAGTIDVSGGAAGACDKAAGPGGGGRVALRVQTLSGFDPASQVKAQGGKRTVCNDATRASYAAAGTVYVQRGAALGDLIVDQGGAGGRPVAQTFLPTVGTGTVGTTGEEATVPGALWIQPQGPTQRFSWTVTGTWVRIGGVDYQILDESADRRRLLLAGAAGQVAAGATFRGVYKLDTLSVRRGARLDFGNDLAEIPAVSIDTDASVRFADTGSVPLQITQPAGDTFVAGDSFKIAAAASDSGAVRSMTLSWAGKTFTATQAPYEWTVSAPPVATASDLVAGVEATDVSGNVLAVARTLHVQPLAPTAAPTVSFLYPGAGALLPVGIGLDVQLQAADNHGLERVELSLDGDATPLTVLAAPYTYHLNAPAGAVDGQVLNLRATAYDYSRQTATATIPVRVIQGTVLNGSQIVDDAALEGASVIVTGGTLTLTGPRTFRDLVVLSGARVTHPETTTTQEHHLDLTVHRDLFVAQGGTIDATGRGYSGAPSTSQRAYGYGNTQAEGAAAGIGGSHGGRGGSFDGSSPIYGSFYDPADPGAGGGATSGSGGEDGGGVVRVTVSGNAVVDGAILANGATGGFGAGGAGGSIRLNAAAIRGAGSIQASGSGSHGGTYGGGSGGRIALYASSIDPGLLSRTLAAGAKTPSINPATWGAAGTVFVKPDAAIQPFGDLILDNGGTASSQLTELLPVGSGIVDAVSASGFTDNEADFRHILGAADVVFNGDFVHPPYPITGNAHHGTSLTLEVLSPPLSAVVHAGDSYQGLYRFNRLIVRGGAQGIARDRVTVVSPNAPEIATGATWNGGYAPAIQITSPAVGATYTSGAGFTAAASVQDVLGVPGVAWSLGGQTFTATTSPYSWGAIAPEVTQPTDFQLSATATDLSGNRLTATRTVRVEPVVDPTAPVVTLASCRASGVPLNAVNPGDLVTPGVAIAIPFVATDNSAVQSYSLVVDGTTVQTVGNLNQASVAASLAWTPPANAAAGTTFNLRVEARDFSGKVGFAALTLSVPAQTVRSSQSLTSALNGQAVTLGSGTFTVQQPLSLASLTLLSGARVVGLAGQPLTLAVTGLLRVQCGGSLDVTALGYAGGQSQGAAGSAPAGITPSAIDAGGSHGGLGTTLDLAGPAGEVYDSLYQPQLGGGGGSVRFMATSGDSGGGVMALNVGQLALDGEIRAKGEMKRNPGYTDASGAGGTVLVMAGTLSGTGLIDASGGDYQTSSQRAGTGGGGRVALYVDTLSGFDPATQVKSWGGTVLNGTTVLRYAGPGTVFVKTAGQSYGRLIVDSGKETSGLERFGPQTPLPVLGTGAVATFQVQGMDALVSAGAVFKLQWLGAWMALKDAAGASLGSFKVLSIDAQGRVLLKDGAAASAAASYRGQYLFDQVDLKSGAGLSTPDELKVSGNVLAEARTRLPAALTAGSMTLKAGSLPVIPAQGGALSLTVSGQLTIETGAALDVTGLGYAGGQSQSAPGSAPAGVTGSAVDAGGSHGGLGTTLDYPGPAGEVYDSLYQPQLGGGGGSVRFMATSGDSGGGVVALNVGQLALNGQIRAKGEMKRNPGYTDASGAGGTVLVTAGTLSGTGLIDASGGDYQASSQRAGTGGGGRVALYVDTLSGFDPATQVKSWGGTVLNGTTVLRYAGPGTVFVKTTGQSYGRLIVDSGKDASGLERFGPQTLLPVLGTGAVATFQVQGVDALVTAGAAFKVQWLGAWMALKDAAGASLGSFKVLSIDAQGRALLKDGAAAAGAASYRGQYLFDQVDLKSGAGLSTTDELKVSGNVLAEAKTRLPATISAASMTIKPGSPVTLGQGGTLSLTVSGQLTIEAGAVLDVTGLGYLGGQSQSTPGTAPAGVTGAGVDAGGSHGGLGTTLDFAGPAGEVYDSAYQPQLGGGGGSVRFSSTSGNSGGGVVSLNVGRLTLDGQIRAKGEVKRTPGYTDATGGGGTVLITAGTLSGAGFIDASGADYQMSSQHAGSGGGGRVALYVDTLSGFDPATQAKVFGGTVLNGTTVQRYASPGTVFVKLPSQTYGKLYVNQGGIVAGKAIPNTPLPVIGNGTVGTATADTLTPAALWITPASTTAKFSLGVIGMWVKVNSAYYRVVDQSADRRQLLLAGATGAVHTGDAYRGVYRFDEVIVRGGARLEFLDDREVNTFTLESPFSVIPSVP